MILILFRKYIYIKLCVPGVKNSRNLEDHLMYFILCFLLCSLIIFNTIFVSVLLNFGATKVKTGSIVGKTLSLFNIYIYI